MYTVARGIVLLFNIPLENASCGRLNGVVMVARGVPEQSLLGHGNSRSEDDMYPAQRYQKGCFFQYKAVSIHKCCVCLCP
jgi:hypothetical protein